MALSNYAELKAEIADWAMRSGDVGFEARVPSFIRLAEVRLSSDVRTADMERFSAGVADQDGYSTLPDDFLAPRSLSTGTPGYPELEYVPPSTYAAAYPGGGVPRAYTIIGNQIRTYPAATGTMSLLYYARIPALSDAAPTNWLLTKYPNIYLYASLLEAAPYMEEDTRAQTWKAYYDTAVAGLRNDDVSARYGRGVVRTMQATP